MKTLSLYVAVLINTAAAQQAAYAQCGGVGWTGGTTCVSGYYCFYSSSYYSQCVPGIASSAAGATAVTTSKSTITSVASSTNAKYAGVNIAGFDFGCLTDGSCDLTQTKDPATSAGYLNGIGQMQHFVKDDHLNAFRLPVAWQYLATNGLDAKLDPARVSSYDALVQGCLATGSICIIDIHNYARWKGGIIGQGGPTNSQFASLWQQIATKYAGSSNVVFGIMNEPHDVDITTWAATVQLVVKTIRNAGATSQKILLPGNNYTSAGTFISSGSASALVGVKNPDGTTTNLIFDVHKYLDSDNSGTHAECVTDNVSDTFAPLAAWLRSSKRQAFLSETGGGNTASCVTYLCRQLAYINSNSDVYLGYTTWSAGEFDTTWNYVLTEVPSLNNGVWTDQLLVSSCVKR